MGHKYWKFWSRHECIAVLIYTLGWAWNILTNPDIRFWTKLRDRYITWIGHKVVYGAINQIYLEINVVFSKSVNSFCFYFKDVSSSIRNFRVLYSDLKFFRSCLLSDEPGGNWSAAIQKECIVGNFDAAVIFRVSKLYRYPSLCCFTDEISYRNIIETDVLFARFNSQF